VHVDKTGETSKLRRGEADVTDNRKCHNGTLRFQPAIFLYLAVQVFNAFSV